MVVLSHVGLAWTYGGFVGVDVFFVISGYLITGLLIREVQSEGRVDFWMFYARRVRRLLPSFVAMLVAAVLLSLWLLPPTQVPLQLESGRWAALWVSNIYFAFADIEYFGAGVESSVFLHTWSLGVEEQFYLIWPALIALVWRSSKRDARRHLVWVLFVVVALGLFASLYGGVRYPLEAYYLLPARLWQLAVGGLAFVLAEHLRSKGVDRGRMAMVGWLGALAVFASVFLITRDTSYPGPWILVPTLGAVAVLCAGALAPGLGVARWLATAPLTFLGRVSYTWYLWHWPLILLMPFIFPGRAWAPVFAAALSLFVSWVCFRLIEHPTRSKKITSAPQIVGVGVLAGVICAVFLTVLSQQLAKREDSPERDPHFARVYRAISAPDIYTRGCDTWYNSAELTPCIDAPPGEPVGTAIVMGDSIGLSWHPALAAAAKRAGWKLIVHTKSACPMADLPYYYERLRRTYTECEQWRASAVADVASVKPDLVILGSSGAYPFSSEEWTAGTQRFLEMLRPSAQRIVVLAPTPMLPFDGPACVVDAMRAGNGEFDALACRAELKSLARNDVIAALEAAATAVPGATVVNLNDLICPDGWCSAWRNEMPVFRDTAHLNGRFAEHLAEPVAQRLELRDSK